MTAVCGSDQAPKAAQPPDAVGVERKHAQPQHTNSPSSLIPVSPAGEAFIKLRKWVLRGSIARGLHNQCRPTELSVMVGLAASSSAGPHTAIQQWIQGLQPS